MTSISAPSSPIATRIIDGRALAAELVAAVALGAAAHLAATGAPPGLAVVRVGDDPASAVYVAAKQRAAARAGLHTTLHHLPAAAAEAGVIATIQALNADPAIDGILVQLPLPAHIAADHVLNAVDPARDVDGFHVVNAGRLANGLAGPVPCTALGCLLLLQHAIGASLAGRHAVVLGRSAIVGRPAASLLLRHDCTVTIAHSRTSDLPGVIQTADILIAAVGRPNLVRGDWIRPGAVVLDVGINRVDGSLVGDVAFAEAIGRAAAITPVPGGVGPMTVACLLRNTLDAARARVASAARA